MQTWTQATTYLQLIGVLLGQLTFGFLGDAIGRRATHAHRHVHHPDWRHHAHSLQWSYHQCKPHLCFDGPA